MPLGVKIRQPLPWPYIFWFSVWWRLIEKQRRHMLNRQNSCLFRYLRHSLAMKIETRFIRAHVWAIANFVFNLKKIGHRSYTRLWYIQIEKQKSLCIYNLVVIIIALSNVNTYIIPPDSVRLSAPFPYQLKSVLCQLVWWGSFKVGRLCQGVYRHINLQMCRKFYLHILKCAGKRCLHILTCAG